MSTTKRCYYETLEVERSADETKLKAAFRKLAMKWHPDKNPGDAQSEVRFKEINEAYEVLKDGDKRAAYDRFGHAAFEQGGGMGAGHPGFGAGFASSFSDIFEDLFGMANQRARGGDGTTAGNAAAWFRFVLVVLASPAARADRCPSGRGRPARLRRQ